MIKDELIFDWRVAESHAGYKISAILLVALAFVGLFGVVNVKLESVRSPGIETANVLYFSNDELGRSWRLLAEEAGPFPGRLESDSDKLLEVVAASGGSGPANGLDGYEIPLVAFESKSTTGLDLFAQKGRRFLPVRSATKSSVTDAGTEPQAVQHTPILVPYDSETLGWMPEQLPVFDIDMKDELLSATWRFVLRLRSDGSVDQCVALNGSGGQGSQAMCGWLSGVRFKPGAEERWIGLRVEFVNR